MITLVVAVLITIIASSIIHHIWPKLPLQLIQIVFGVILALISNKTKIELEPEIFMVLIIAPLLYREAQEADIASLWRTRRQVFLLAFPLVFITMFAVGFAVHLLLPNLPWAICFAVGAILGPTDLVAVSSLGRRFKINDKVSNILKGEGLINDASGLVAFRFAIGVFLAGSFSLADASWQLFYVAIGGVLIGLIIATIKRQLTLYLRHFSVEHTTTYVLIELIIPFLAYELAEALGTSGILAAVAAGTRQAMVMRRTGLFEAELRAAKESAWQLVTFVLNGLVFLLLGLQLPHIIEEIHDYHEHGWLYLVGVILTAAAMLMVVRFFSVWTFTGRELGKKLRERLRNISVLTLSGIKGTVSLSMALSLPIFMADGSIFADRPLLILITAGVIIFLLLLALITLPLIAEPKERPAGDIRVKIIRAVIARLSQEPGQNCNYVIASYRRRMHELIFDNYSPDDKKSLAKIRNKLFRAEVAALKTYIKTDNRAHVSVYRTYAELMTVIYKRRYMDVWRKIIPDIRRMQHNVAALRSRHERLSHIRQNRKQDFAELQQLFSENSSLMQQEITKIRGNYPRRILTDLSTQRQDLLEEVKNGNYAQVILGRTYLMYENELLHGYAIEREVIAQFQDAGKMSREQARKMLLNVNKLESHVYESRRNSGLMLNLINHMSN